MNEKLPYWGSLFFSATAIILLVVNISLSNNNRTLQTDVTQRQTQINGGQALSQVNQSLVQAMAEASLKNNNTQLHELLTAQGITLKTDKPAATTPASSSTATPAAPAKPTSKK